jgi:hypothetical protein
MVRGRRARRERTGFCQAADTATKGSIAERLASISASRCAWQPPQPPPARHRSVSSSTVRAPELMAAVTVRSVTASQWQTNTVIASGPRSGSHRACPVQSGPRPPPPRSRTSPEVGSQLPLPRRRHTADPGQAPGAPSQPAAGRHGRHRGPPAPSSGRTGRDQVLWNRNQALSAPPLLLIVTPGSPHSEGMASLRFEVPLRQEVRGLDHLVRHSPASRVGQRSRALAGGHPPSGFSAVALTALAPSAVTRTTDAHRPPQLSHPKPTFGTSASRRSLGARGRELLLEPPT